KKSKMSLSGDNNVVHSTSILKQQNKPLKTGRCRSQHEIKRRSKGFYFQFFCL
ncbi:unnamed protein product, partial [Rotaria sp. Silwood2]